MAEHIACSLTPSAARGQLDEWRDLLAASVTAVERVSPTELALRLDDRLGQLVAVTRLAQREKACCPFFDFTIGIGAEAVTLHVTAPQEAAALLDALAGMTRPAS
jgi:hypothetical protein